MSGPVAQDAVPRGPWGAIAVMIAVARIGAGPWGFASTDRDGWWAGIRGVLGAAIGGPMGMGRRRWGGGRSLIPAQG